ncbi:MAG: ATP-binding protein [Pseudomonadota bacterium]
MSAASIQQLVMKHVLSPGRSHGPDSLPVHRVGECLCGMAAAERSPVISKDIHNDSRCTWKECREAGLHSLAAIPLVSGEDMLGVMAVGTYGERDFSSQNNFLSAMATQITIGLKNALLYEQIQNHARELDEKLSIITRSEEEKSRLHAQLLQAQKMEAVGTLAGGIAHDFNNLLQTIVGYTDLLLLKRAKGDPDQGPLGIIRNAARDGADLVSRIMTFSRKAEPKLRPVHLNDEITRVEKLLHRTLSKMIRIDLRLTKDLSIIHADPTQIEQVMLNLGVNAQHAMPDGGRLTIETSNVSLSDEHLKSHPKAKPGKYVLLKVSDTGAGMEPEVLDRIFEPFFTTKAGGVGTGLGLSMVHGIVSQHGGFIRCYSEPGKGTSFKIHFPISESRLALDPTLTREMPAFGTETILLVDDDDRIREMGRQMIETAGYTVLTARSGEEALETYTERGAEISLVILDLIMPGIGGKRCLEELLRMDPDVRVLVASGYSPDGIGKGGNWPGARGFISKPYDAKAIMAAIRTVLDEGYL